MEDVQICSIVLNDMIGSSRRRLAVAHVIKHLRSALDLQVRLHRLVLRQCQVFRWLKWVLELGHWLVQQGRGLICHFEPWFSRFLVLVG